MTDIREKLCSVNHKELKSHYLYPGNLFADKEPYVVTTVLGSCVSVCLWDDVKRQGGINHYMLPIWHGEGKGTPKYGTSAIIHLYEKMIRLGSKHENLHAKVFGGANVLQARETPNNIGKNNISIALDLLKDLHIPIVSKSTGGEFGRKLIYCTESGVVMMKQMNKIPTDKVV